MKLSDFNTLTEAQSYIETRYQFFNNNTMNSILAQTKLLAPLEVIISDPLHPFFNESKALLTSEEFNFRRDSTTGLLQISMLDDMINAPITVDMGGVIVDLTTQLTILKNVAVEKVANVQIQPFLNTTQAEFDAANFIPVKAEVSYGDGMTYIITTGNQGIDVQLTNISVDGDFELYLDTCADSADQHLDASYIPYAGGQAVARITSKNGVAQFSLSNRKVRQYNRLYVKALHDCTYTAKALVNRG